jgi:hypothetical protein
MAGKFGSVTSDQIKLELICMIEATANDVQVYETWRDVWRMALSRILLQTRG